jgi:hypothetical protein
MKYTNNLYDRLVKEKRRLGTFVLRSPVTTKQVKDKERYGRIFTILVRRYEEGLDEALDAMKRADQIDEIKTIKRF